MIMIQTGLGVALRKESVDRNFNAVQIVIVIMVALRKESVDRNSTTRIGKKVENVALRKESVDRNFNEMSSQEIFWSRSPQGERG